MSTTTYTTESTTRLCSGKLFEKALDRMVLANSNSQDRLDKALMHALKPISPGVLDLTRIPMREERMEYTLDCIIQSKGKITKLNLAYCKLDKFYGAFCKLCQFLESPLTRLHTIDLSYNFLEDKEHNLLVKSLRGNRNVKHLRLRLMHIEGKAGGHCLANLLQGNSTLVRIDVSKNRRMGLEGAKELAIGLSNNQFLEELDLGDCAIEDEAAAIIIRSLVGHTRLRRIKMARNQLSFQSITAICDLLKFPRSRLRLLDISYNPNLFGEPNLGLPNSNPPDQEGNIIVLADQRVTPTQTAKQKQASEALSNAIQGHSFIREINLSHCDICGETAQLLFQSLESNTSVKNFQLIGNQLGTSGYAGLFESIGKFRRLVELGMDSGDFPQSRMEQYVHALTKNTSICRVPTESHPTISFKDPTRMNDFYSDLKSCIHKNQALKEIGDNPDLHVYVWVPVIARFASFSAEHKANSNQTEEELEAKKGKEKMKATFVYQIIQLLLPHQAERMNK